MGGQIHVESRFGEGTAFIFDVTLQEQQDQVKTLKQFSNKKALIVDDSSSWRGILKDMLEPYGIKTTLVSSGQQAVAKIVRDGQKYDLILMDWLMPDLNGLETAKIINECSDTHQPATIIMVSAYHQETVMNAAREREIRAFLSKPVNPSHLCNLFMEIFSNKGYQGEYSHDIDTEKLKNQLTTLHGSHILLVEDNAINREIICGMLKHSGIIVDEAPDGRICVDMYHKFPDQYELILMDIQMPGMDGYEATTRIRQVDKEIPIIALTANAMATDVEKAIEHGASEHIAKPVDVNKLFSALLKYITPKQAFRQIEIDARKNDGLPEFKILDVQSGLRHMVGDMALYTKVLKNFVSEFQDVGKKLRALMNTDKDEAKRIAHTVKGLSANIGAHTLHKIAVKLDSTMDELFLQPFEQELARVLGDIKNSGILDEGQGQVQQTCITAERLNQLLKQLESAIEKRRPQRITPLMEELDGARLNDKDRQMIDLLKAMVEKYQFKDALDLLNRRGQSHEDKGPGKK